MYFVSNTAEFPYPTNSEDLVRHAASMASLAQDLFPSILHNAVYSNSPNVFVSVSRSTLGEVGMAFDRNTVSAVAIKATAEGLRAKVPSLQVGIQGEHGLRHVISAGVNDPTRISFHEMRLKDTEYLSRVPMPPSHRTIRNAGRLIHLQSGEFPSAQLLSSAVEGDTWRSDPEAALVANGPNRYTIRRRAGDNGTRVTAETCGAPIIAEDHSAAPLDDRQKQLVDAYGAHALAYDELETVINTLRRYAAGELRLPVNGSNESLAIL